MLLIFLLIFVLAITLVSACYGGRKYVPGELHLGEAWFEEVKSGKKTIDIRPGALDRYGDLAGKKIVYYNKKDRVEVSCTDVKHYKSLKDLIASEDLKKIAPHLGSEEKIKENILTYYTEERIKNMGGICAIHFKK